MEFTPLVCEKCGSTFLRKNSLLKSYEKRGRIMRNFCSKECKDLSERIELPECITAEYAAGSSCAKLAAKYETTYSTIRNRLLFLGVRLRGRSNPGAKNGMYGKTHTEEARGKIRAANKRQFSRPEAREAASRKTTENMQSGKLKRSSKIEEKVADVLSEMGVPFVAQKAFRDSEGRFSACADFFLPGLNTVLEVNGTYWHADPRVYPPDSINATQRHNLEAYERKLAIYAELGIRLIEVWEKDIRVDARSAVKQALS